MSRRAYAAWAMLLAVGIAVIVGVSLLMHDESPRTEPRIADGTDAASIAPEPVLAGQRAVGAGVDVEVAPTTPSAEADVPRAPGSLVVVVRGAPGAMAIEGADVALLSEEAREVALKRTEADGTARFEALPSTSLWIRARAPGRVIAFRHLSPATEAVERRVEITLLPGAKLYGLVLARASRQPVPGAGITVRKGGEVAGMSMTSSDPPFERLVSDVTGRFEVDGVPLGGIVTVEVSARGWVPAGRSLVLGDGAASHPVVELLLDPGAEASGRVVDDTGRPVAGALVRAIALGTDDDESSPAALEERIGPWAFFGEPGASATSDAMGRFEVTGLHIGRAYRFLARTPLVRSALTHPATRIEEGKVHGLGDLRLLRAGSLTIHVVDGEGASLGDARIGMEVPDRDLVATTVAPAVLRFESLPAGRHDVRVSRVGYVARDVVADVPAGEAVELRVALERGAAIDGVVVDDLGKPVAGAIVEAEPVASGSGAPESRGGAMASSDVEGRFRIDGLRARRHRLTGVASRHGYALPVEVDAPSVGASVVVPRLASLRARLKLPGGSPDPHEVEIGVEQLALGKGQGTTRGWDGGNVMLTDVAPAEVRLVIHVEGYAPLIRTETFAPGVERDLGELLLGPGLALSGRVLDAGGKGLAGARVRVSMPGVLDDVVGTADGDGAYRVARLPTGVHRVWFEAEGHLPLAVRLSFDQESVSRTVTLVRGVRVRGRVRSERAAGVAGLRVVVRRAGSTSADGDGTWDTTADDHGSFELDVPHGPLLIEVRDATTDAVLDVEGPLTPSTSTPLVVEIP